MSDYELPRDGIDAQVKRERDIQNQFRALRGGNDAESTVIGSGGITVKGGSIIGEYPNGVEGLAFGRHMTTSGGDHYLLDGLVINDRDGVERVSLYQFTDDSPTGPIFVSRISGESAQLDGTTDAMVTSPNQVVIYAPQVAITGIPTTSSAANLHMGTVGGAYTIATVTSSERYKQDIADFDIDPDAVLRWRPRTWRDRTDVEATGDDAIEHVGFIAEEIHDETPEFVVCDDEGRPDSLKYDRMVAGLLAVVQRQAEQIADLTARVETLEVA